jgi:hypothetical protein
MIDGRDVIGVGAAVLAMLVGWVWETASSNV